MILNQIVEDKRKHVEIAKALCPVKDLELSRKFDRRSLIRSIESRRVPVIAEIKKRSPSGGNMGSQYGLAELALIYDKNGAAGISVLTDEKYFGGKPQDMLEARRRSTLPILRKDFIIDEYQIYEAFAFGADAILLIAAILDDSQISRYLALAHELGMEVLVESHTKVELEKAIRSGAKLLGINNRNLDTLKTDLSISLSLLQLVPDDRIAISESGISKSSDIKMLLEAGAKGFLIGESLLKNKDPGGKLTELINVRV